MSILRRIVTYLRSRHDQDADAPAHEAASATAAGQQEEALRERLTHDPNDLEAFAELAGLVRRRTEGTEQPAPLIADSGGFDLRSWNRASRWALAEELAGNPRAWYPLIELARLSLDDDHEAAMRRLSTACERDRSGRALEEAIKMLRAQHQPAEAWALGVGHWAPADQTPEAGRQVVLAALDADRPGEARTHLQNLTEYGAEQPGTAGVVAELEPFVTAAQERAASNEQ